MVQYISNNSDNNTITREVTASPRITTYHCITASLHYGITKWTRAGSAWINCMIIIYDIYIYIYKDYIDNLYSTEIGKHRVCISYMVFVHKQSNEWATLNNYIETIKQYIYTKYTRYFYSVFKKKKKNKQKQKTSSYKSSEMELCD